MYLVYQVPQVLPLLHLVYILLRTRNGFRLFNGNETSRRHNATSDHIKPLNTNNYYEGPEKIGPTYVCIP